MTRRSLLTMALCFFTLSLTATAVDGAKQRMHARLAKVIQFKKAAAVGENNKGYLTALKKSTGIQKIVSDENKDRHTVYGIIAKKHGSTTAKVGHQRAKTIRQKAQRGTMLQNDQGKWYKK